MAKKKPQSKKTKAKKVDNSANAAEENVETLVINAGSAMAMFEMQGDSVDFVDEVTAEAEALEASGTEAGDIGFDTSSAIDASIFDASATGNEDSVVAALDDEALSFDGEMSTLESDEEMAVTAADTEGTELEGFASAEIEDVEEIPEEKMVSIVESLLFASDKPQSVAVLKAAFAGTKIRSADIRKALKHLEVEYMSGNRGVELVEVASGYQIRTKPENAVYMQRTIKARPFRLSGPALEVLSIVAYKQPCPKAMVDEIRGVESGHLMRGLLDRGLINFGEKSDLPGRPMYYETTRKFLEIFGLRQVQELPTLNEIDQLIPEGIGQPEEEKKQTLSDLTGELSQTVGTTYSEGEADLTSISEELQGINLSTAFFEEEKLRQRQKKDLEKAQEIRERMVIGETVATREKNWLEKFDNGTLYTEKVNPFAKKKQTEVLADGIEATTAEVSAEGAEASEATAPAVYVEEPVNIEEAVSVLVGPIDEPTDVPMMDEVESPLALEVSESAAELATTTDDLMEDMELDEMLADEEELAEEALVGDEALGAQETNEELVSDEALFADTDGSEPEDTPQI